MDGEVHVDPTLSFGYYARLAQRLHEAAALALSNGQRDKARVLLLRFTTLCLEGLPRHPEYQSPKHRDDKRRLLALCRNAITVLEKFKSEALQQSETGTSGGAGTGTTTLQSSSSSSPSAMHDTSSSEASLLTHSTGAIGEESEGHETDNAWPVEVAAAELPSSTDSPSQQTQPETPQESTGTPETEHGVIASRHQRGPPGRVRLLRRDSDFEIILGAGHGNGSGEIGAGTFGKVYKVRDCQTDTVCVMKRIPYSSPSDVQAITRETMLLRKLVHPNIVAYRTLFASQRVPESMCLVMEYCNGGDLQAWMEQYVCRPDVTLHPATTPTLPEAVLLHWMEQLARALAFVHASGILHRDLKPSNFLLVTPASPLEDYFTQHYPHTLPSLKPSAGGRRDDHPPSDDATSPEAAYMPSHPEFHLPREFLSSGSPFPPIIKLGDFGLGYELGPSREFASTRAGTVIYWPPEIMAAQASSKASEVYSFGAIFIELALAPGMVATSLLLPKDLALHLARLRALYSEAFADALVDMINFAPEDRPSFNETVLALQLIQQLNLKGV